MRRGTWAMSVNLTFIEFELPKDSGYTPPPRPEVKVTKLQQVAAFV